MSRFATPVAAAAAVLVLAACTVNPQTEPTVGQGVADLAPDGSVASPTPVGDAAQPPEFVRGNAQPFVPESVPSTEDQDTAGSGCVPGVTDDLPDGVWRGFITEVDDESMEFDLICSWRFDSEAFRNEITQRGPDDGPVLYVTENSNPLERTLTLAPSVQVWPQDLDGVAWEIGVFVAQHANGGWDEAWVFINDGEVTEISQVYYP